MQSDQQIHLDPAFRRGKFLNFFMHSLPSYFKFSSHGTYHVALINNLNFQGERLPRIKIDRASKAYARRSRGKTSSIWSPGKTTRVFRIIDEQNEESFLYLFSAATQRGCLVEAGLCPPICMVSKKSDPLEVGLLADRSLEEL